VILEHIRLEALEKQMKGSKQNFYLCKSMKTVSVNENNSVLNKRTEVSHKRNKLDV